MSDRPEGTATLCGEEKLSTHALNIDDVPTKAGIEKIMALTAPGMGRVNELILERAGSHVEMVPEIAKYLIEAGGKRLRPMLTLAAAMAAGDETENSVRYAAAVEFMHTATLLHDDVVDESEKRRGKLAARMVWGNPASVLVGDYLLGQAFIMMVEAGDINALGVLSRAAATIAEGEVHQLAKAKTRDFSATDYFEIIDAKTAALFAAATEVGAMAGGADEATRNALRDYGRALGIAFQLIDDLLDYGGTSGTLGKNAGDDLREGKLTLPAILGLERASASDRGIIEAALGDSAVAASSVGEVVAVLDKTGALTESALEAETHAEAARTALSKLPDSPAREALAEVIDFNLARVF